MKNICGRENCEVLKKINNVPVYFHHPRLPLKLSTTFHCNTTGIRPLSFIFIFHFFVFFLQNRLCMFSLHSRQMSSLDFLYNCRNSFLAFKMQLNLRKAINQETRIVLHANNKLFVRAMIYEMQSTFIMLNIQL